MLTAKGLIFAGSAKGLSSAIYLFFRADVRESNKDLFGGSTSLLQISFLSQFSLLARSGSTVCTVSIMYVHVHTYVRSISNTGSSSIFCHEIETGNCFVNKIIYT